MGRTNSVLKTLMVGEKPAAIAVNPITDIVYVANSGNNTVSVIDGYRLCG
ncbi:MAG: hypothetical protein M3044_10475 [Thermoproteota archaeon]|nr:hypothetical protein [Thermoproteota archaeon]